MAAVLSRYGGGGPNTTTDSITPWDRLQNYLTEELYLVYVRLLGHDFYPKVSDRCVGMDSNMKIPSVDVSLGPCGTYLLVTAHCECIEMELNPCHSEARHMHNSIPRLHPTNVSLGWSPSQLQALSILIDAQNISHSKYLSRWHDGLKHITPTSW